MENQVKEALQYYAKGYTCAQAVMCAYADEMDIDKTIFYKMAEGFGGGCGGMQEICGAVSAAFAIISFHYSDGNLDDGKSMRKTYAKIREAAGLFKEEFGSIVCKEVLDGNKPQAFKCGKKVRVAAEIVDRIITNNQLN
ncbi:C_GCAxxG_C_C family probable redox protein [Eubacterium aggregans]|uniref:C_GCAxxG_C_C family probable redox protein n=1 Tax=Eubacterium aggregans TaxID=81409 RepID=A0A1H3WT29_9FIRM|nr:C-GCAxxG-C-C family protein [Eubacterium aggregans]SDZ90317.1 C_GCAxxG_C_C family probable redox protein [Eubacterium aggregans]